MLGGVERDPREGDRRQKALAKALAARSSALSRFSKTGQGRGARTGAGIRFASRGARPTSFLSGKGPNAFGRGGVNFFGANPGGLGALVAATQMPTQALPGGGGEESLPSGGGSPMAPQGPDVPLEEGGSYFDPSIPVGEPGGQTHGDAIEGNFENIWGFNQTTPSAPIGVPGGYIPLGGGVFYDPETGVMHGTGGLFG